MTALLTVERLNKRFGGLHAVKDVSFTLQAGSITGVLGPNGAGKTTMFNLLTGFLPFDVGRVEFDGQSLGGLPPHKIVNRGLVRTFQLARPFLGMTVLENVEVACLAPRVRGQGRASVRAQALLDEVGLGEKSSQPVDVLPYGDLRRLEIARALATRPKLLLLDEPFAGLGVTEIQPLADLISALHRSEGLTILIIEHKLREFMQLVQEVIAMDFGEVVAIGTPTEIVRDPRVIEAYIGKSPFEEQQLIVTGDDVGLARGQRSGRSLR
ncbi:MAG: ABC transporter ATP-binding protein [Bradyrhizobiaceae bacterium]|nr:ABC transporter ATP-binding protein [Bradyrhizobiaceae bacterium]